MRTVAVSALQLHGLGYCLGAGLAQAGVLLAPEQGESLVADTKAFPDAEPRSKPILREASWDPL